MLGLIVQILMNLGAEELRQLVMSCSLLLSICSTLVEKVDAWQDGRLGGESAGDEVVEGLQPVGTKGRTAFPIVICQFV